MIRRTFDAERVNYLINHPSVRPFVGGDGESFIDLTAAVADKQNIFVDGEHGGFAFTWSAPCVYEVHTFVLPEGRGQWAADAAMTARAFMQNNGGRHLWTRVQPDAANVRKFTLKAGFEPAGQHTIDLGDGPVTYDLFDWRSPCPQ